MSMKHQNTVISRFNNNTDIIRAKDHVLGPSPDILINTVGLLRVGLTCMGAFCLVIMGPEWLKR